MSYVKIHMYTSIYTITLGIGVAILALIYISSKILNPSSGYLILVSIIQMKTDTVYFRGEKEEK